MATLTPHRSPVRVAVVDAHPVFRAGIVQTLLHAGGCEVVAEGEDAADAKTIAQRLAPDVMVLDLQAELNGGQIRQITDECSTVRIVILTAAVGRDQINDALRAGAAGYLPKSATGAELAESVQRVHRGEVYVQPSLAARLLGLVKPDPKLDRFSSLTRREQAILNQLACGLSNKEIGRKLNLSDQTVKNYLTALFQKLEARNRLQAAILARQLSAEAAFHRPVKQKVEAGRRR